MKFIGITGGVGSGKSELLRYIRNNYSCEIYLADEVAHDLQKQGADLYFEILNLLGSDICAEDGEIDRKKMAEKIFGDSDLLARVNGLIHPAVVQFMLGQKEKAEAEGRVEYFFVEAALLIEVGFTEIVDEMWYIYVREEIRRERLKASRGYSDEKIDRIMRSQLSEEAFRENCDFVLDNSGTLEESYVQIRNRLSQF